MSKPPGFIDKHGLWTDEQKSRAEEIKRRLATGEPKYIRLAWGDTHGYSRAKTLTVPAFLAALTVGHNIGVATTTLDSAGARVFASFTRGGGMGLDEMTGGRSPSRPASFCARRCAASAITDMAAWWAPRSSGTSCAWPRII